MTLGGQKFSVFLLAALAAFLVVAAVVPGGEHIFILRQTRFQPAAKPSGLRTVRVVVVVGGRAV